MAYTIDTHRLYIGDGETVGGLDIATMLVDDVLKISRTTDSDRLSYVLPADHIIYTVDTKKLYIGDGVTAGGLGLDNTVPAFIPGIPTVSTDTTPMLGGNLDLNTHDIVGCGNIAIDGKLRVGSLFIENNVLKVTGIYDPALIFKTESHGIVEFSGVTHGASSSHLYITTTRGSVASPESTQAGDKLGGITFTGLVDGTNKTAVSLNSKWSPDAVFGPDSGNGLLEILVNTDAVSHVPSDVVGQYTFNHKGVLSAPILKVGSYTTDTIPVGEEGMIIFNTTTKTFQGWNGTEWTILG